MVRLPTDRQILRRVFDMYELDYPVKGDPHIPIDLQAVAVKLKCSQRLLYGRLYYDMGTRLKHRDPSDSTVVLASVFEPKAGDKINVVNFPYLVSVLATLEEQRRRDLSTFWLSIVAIVVAFASAGTAVYQAVSGV